MFATIAPYLKAVVGFLAPGLVIIAAALSDGNAPTVSQWYTALGAALAAGVVVYLVPNAEAE